MLYLTLFFRTDGAVEWIRVALLTKADASSFVTVGTLGVRNAGDFTGRTIRLHPNYIGSFLFCRVWNQAQSFVRLSNVVFDLFDIVTRPEVQIKISWQDVSQNVVILSLQSRGNRNNLCDVCNLPIC